jgi:hypothetical protein
MTFINLYDKISFVLDVYRFMGRKEDFIDIKSKIKT